MIQLDDRALLMIEPRRLPRRGPPTLGDLTARMVWALKLAGQGEQYFGWHDCVCGARSGSCDLIVWLQGVHRNVLTNSLAAHYLAWHYDEIPESELVKVALLPPPASLVILPGDIAPPQKWGAS